MKTQKNVKYWLLGVIVSMAMSAFAEQTPLYPTGLVLDNQGKLVMSEKGQKRVAVYSSDGRKLEKAYAMPEIPTGVAVCENFLYVTTCETKGVLRVLDLSDGKEIAAVETGSGACSPLVNKETGKLYVCNQFQNKVI